MNFPDDLTPGAICLYGGNGGGEGFAAKLIEIREDDPDTDHVALYIGGGKVFTAFPRGGVNVYDFSPTGLVHVRQPLGTVNLAKLLAWIPTVQGAPYGWIDIEADAGKKEPPQPFVPDAATIHVTGAHCSHTVAMGCEVLEVPQFEPAFDKRLVEPYHFKMSVASKRVWDVSQMATNLTPASPDLSPRAEGEQIQHTP
ncbi:MAG TPA: hypothetical protein VGJ73_21210 [Verrucomicrobiae bacterium]|jgi:hypothetical protein